MFASHFRRPRRRWAGSACAGLQSLIGGELKGMTTQLADSRNQAVQRLVEEAKAKGANGIIAMRFDASELGTTWTEICAYGTAVRLSRI